MVPRLHGRGRGLDVIGLLVVNKDSLESKPGRVDSVTENPGLSFPAAFDPVCQFVQDFPRKAASGKAV